VAGKVDLVLGGQFKKIYKEVGAGLLHLNMSGLLRGNKDSQDPDNTQENHRMRNNV